MIKRLDFGSLRHLLHQGILIIFVIFISAYSYSADAARVTQQELAPLMEVEEPGFSEIETNTTADVDLSQEINTQPAPKKVGSQSALCVGVTESWKLVPVPDEEGQFIICNTENFDETATGGELDIALNNYREGHGLAKLTVDSSLCKVAAERTEEIKSNFSHDGFEAAVERNNISYSSVGENIASGSLSATKFVEWSWDKSPGHRANMLKDWTRGCGAVSAGHAVYIFAK